MMDLIGEFENLKISALSKSKILNSTIHNVTLGPDSIRDNSLVINTKKIDSSKSKRNVITVETMKPAVFNTAIRTLQEMEFQRRNQVKEAVTKRCQMFVDFSKQQANQRRQTWAQKQMSIINDIKRQETQIIQALDHRDHEAEVNDARITKLYEDQATKKLQEIKAATASKELQNQTTDLKNLQDAIKQQELLFRKEYSEMINILLKLDPQMKAMYFNVYKQSGDKLYYKITAVMQNLVAGKTDGTEEETVRKVLGQIGYLKENLKTQVLNKQSNEKNQGETELQSEKEMQNLLDTIKKHHDIFKSEYEQISSALQQINPQKRQLRLAEQEREMKHLSLAMDSIMEKYLSSKVDDKDVTNAFKLLEDINVLKAVINERISEDNLSEVDSVTNFGQNESQPDTNVGLQEKSISELQNIFGTIQQCQVIFTKEYEEVVKMLNTFDQENKNLYLTGYLQIMKTLGISMESIVKNCISGKIDEEESQKAQKVKDGILKLKQNILGKLLELNKSNTDPEKNTIESSTMQQTTNTAKDNVKFNQGNKLSLVKFVELQNFAESYENIAKALQNDQTYKQFKSDCKKAVNMPVNAISAVSKAHLIDKYNKLVNLLSGNRVPIGDNIIIATKHPQGIPYCMDLLARKFVLQGDLMISSNPDASYAYAYVIVPLWKKFPDFGKLFLAHLYKQCPYLFPVYFPKLPNHTNEEFYTSHGYQYVNGEIESQEKFLKRMTGITRLYATILVMKYDRGNEADGPHGLSHAWMWLAAILNLQPRYQISANVLHTFLETAGYSLQKTYGRQFSKVMAYIENVYLGILKEIDTGGPLTRLTNLLKEYRKNRGFTKPDSDRWKILERDFYV